MMCIRFIVFFYFIHFIKGLTAPNLILNEININNQFIEIKNLADDEVSLSNINIQLLEKNSGLQSLGEETLSGTIAANSILRIYINGRRRIGRNISIAVDLSFPTDKNVVILLKFCEILFLN